MVLKPPARAEWGAHGAAPGRPLTLLVAPAAARDVLVGSLEHVRSQVSATTFVVKRAFTFDGAGSLMRCAPRWTIGRGSRHPVDHADALDASSDFVPWKTRADLVIVGRATFGTPQTRSDIVVQAGGRRVERTVRATVPAAELPLSMSYLGGDRLGPARGAAPGGGMYFDDVADDGFQAAPTDLRFDLGVLERAPTIALLGLLAGFAGKPLVLALPGERPLLRIFDRKGNERGVDAALDTVRIDLDERRVDLTYRATEPGRPADVVVFDGFRPIGAPPDASVGRERVRHVAAAVMTEDDARLEREPELDAVARQMVVADALAGPLPQPTLDLQRYAEVHADLAERPKHRPEVLRAHGFDDVSWTIEERAWLERMAEDAMRGDPSSATAFGSLFVEAQDQLVTPRETEMPLDEFARLTVVVERAEEPIEALEDETLTFAQWMRLGRIWSQRTDGDPRLERALETAIERERARAGSED